MHATSWRSLLPHPASAVPLLFVQSGWDTRPALLNDVIGDLLPSALALGWIAGLLAVSVIVVVLLGAGGDPDSDGPGISWLKVAMRSPEPRHLRLAAR